MHVCLFVQMGEKIRVAIKTCKECSADVKEKFLSEAGEYEAGSGIISSCAYCSTSKSGDSTGQPARTL